jgi:hypothetical protein
VLPRTAAMDGLRQGLLALRREWLALCSRLATARHLAELRNRHDPEATERRLGGGHARDGA